MTIDVARFIDERPVSRYQWSIFFAAMAVALLDGYDLQSMALASRSIAAEWGIPVADFKPVMTAIPLGMFVGSFAFGFLADRFGRKWPVIVATAFIGLFSLLTPFMNSIESMAICRFMMGLGTGGILPNLIALVSEYTPERKRGSLTTLSFSAIPLGSALGAALALYLLPAHGWHSVFYVGGVIPLLIAAWAVFRLPESIRFLAARGNNQVRIAEILSRISGERIDPNTKFTLPEATKSNKVALARLFGPGRTAPTLLVTFALMCNTIMLYFMLSWLPAVFDLAGFTREQANLATILPNLGGWVGAIVLGRFIDRFNGFRVMMVGGLVAATGLVATGFGYTSPWLLIPCLFFAGTCVMGGQPAIYVLLAQLFPTTIRSTGAGFSLGMARIGSFIGPWVGGMILAQQWQVQEIFMIAALPGLGVASCMWLTSRVRRDFV